jgi:hypothetical protein
MATMFSGTPARPGFSVGGERPLDQSSATSNRIQGDRDSLRLDSTLVMKRGRKYHAFDTSAAPYPLSYDSKVLDVYVVGLPREHVRRALTVLLLLRRDVLDHIYLVRTQNSVSWVDFKDKPPTRSLDLGCGVSCS